MEQGCANLNISDSCYSPVPHRSSGESFNVSYYTCDCRFLECSSSLVYHPYYTINEADGSLTVEGIPLPGMTYCITCENGTLFAVFCDTEDNFLVQGICMIVSLLLLVVTAAVYKLNSKLSQSSNSPYIVSQSLSMAIAFICLIRMKLFPQVENELMCLIAGYSLQYFFLAAWLWMNAKCINVYMKISQRRPTTGISIKMLNRKEFERLSIYAWGTPLLITAITFCIQQMRSTSMGKTTCFFDDPCAKWIYFNGPMVLVVSMNFALFMMTLVIIVKHKHSFDASKRMSRHLQKEIWYFYQYVKLFVLTGLAWAMEVVATIMKDEHPRSIWEDIWYFLDVFNCLEGLVFFLCFICQRGVIKKIVGSRRGADASRSRSAQATPSIGIFEIATKSQKQDVIKINKQCGLNVVRHSKNDKAVQHKCYSL